MSIVSSARPRAIMCLNGNTARAREEGIKKRRGDLEKMNKQYAVLA